MAKKKVKSRYHFDREWRDQIPIGGTVKRAAWHWYKIGREFGEKEIQRRQSANILRKANLADTEQDSEGK